MAGRDAIRHTDLTGKRVQSAAFIIGVLVCGVLCIGFSVSEARFSESTVVPEIDTSINPNEAPAASLVRLPGIGMSRAAAIVEYRQDILGGRAFRNCNDLQNVQGIGPKTAGRLAEYLRFE